MAQITTHTYTIAGMDCADCARHVEQGVAQLPGVAHPRVNFITGLLDFEGETDETALAQRVEALGYHLLPAQTAPTGDPAKRESSLVGFLHFLWGQGEMHLALGGGAALLFSVLLPLPGTLRQALQIIALAVAGYPVARVGLVTLWINHTISINLLMTIAAIGAVILGDLTEAATLIFLFDLSEALEGYTTDRARRTLGQLNQLAPSQAQRLGPAGEETVPVAQLQPGEHILVRPGERLPVDGRVASGASEVNQAPITGESLPVPKAGGDEVYAGSINGSGALIVQVTHLAADSTLARIVRMVTEAQSRRAPSQRLIDRFAQIYTPAVVAVAVLVAAVPPLFFGQPFLSSPGETGWLYRALALLVISCPCALVISAPATIISAITAAARQGVLFKGGAYLEALAGVRQVAFDKTGTLTQGAPAVTHYQAVDCTGTEDCPACQDVLALAAALEQRSSHPLARAVVGAAGVQGLAGRYPAAEDLTQLNGRGLQGHIGGQLATIGSHALFDDQHPHPAAFCQTVSQAEEGGQTAMLLCDGQRVRGFITVADQPRPESQAVVAELHQLGLRTAMLTGDNRAVAANVGAQLGIDDVRAGLLPDEKVAAVAALNVAAGQVAMVGDGINDTPALSAASLGIAMGGAGSPAAMETADVVLMSGDLTHLPFAIRLARRAMTLIRQNVAASLAIKLGFILLAMGGVASLWMAVAADTGLALLVTLNGLRAGRVRYEPIPFQD
jgi:Cd2+/Zn2+-exporting ATPase